MEKNALLIRKPQNKESIIGNSFQVMLLLLIFMFQAEMEWEKKLTQELLYIKEKWMFNIILRVKVLELSSLLSTNNSQLFHSLLEALKI